MEKIKFLGDGIVTGYGRRLAGRSMYAQDFSVLAGSLSQTLAEKICKVMDLGIAHGHSSRRPERLRRRPVQEGIEALCGYTEIFTRNVLTSGVVPQISGIFRTLRRWRGVFPGPDEFIIMVKIQSLHVPHRPQGRQDRVPRGRDHRATGWCGHAQHQSGVADYAADDEDDAIQYIKDLMSYLPQNNMENPPDAPAEAIPSPANRRCSTTSFRTTPTQPMT